MNQRVSDMVQAMLIVIAVIVAVPIAFRILVSVSVYSIEANASAKFQEVADRVAAGTTAEDWRR